MRPTAGAGKGVGGGIGGTKTNALTSTISNINAKTMEESINGGKSPVLKTKRGIGVGRREV
jgi:hypothetical protein